MAKGISKHDAQYWEFALNGNIRKLVLDMCIPLTMYQCLNQLFKMLDTVLASGIGSSTVTTVSYLSQINIMLSALGGGLAVGASIKVSEAFGAGNLKLLRQRISTLFAMCGILGGFLLLITVFFTPQILRLFHTPDALIREGTSYFIVEMFSMVLGFFNNIYICIERCRGRSRHIFWLNLATAATKTVMSLLLVRSWEPLGFGKPDIILLSIATFISQCVIFSAVLRFIGQKDETFCVSIRDITFRRDITLPMLQLSFPVMVERMAFSLSKVMVNAMCVSDMVHYHPDTVGATSVSNHISIVLTPQNGFQEGGSSLISQNNGGKKPERVVEIFKTILLIDLISGTIMALLTWLLVEPISMISAANNREFANMIASIYRYEALAAIPLGIHSAVVGLMYGLGKTKQTLVMNFCRVFVFRVPVLYYLQNFTDFGRTDGPHTIGICLAVSNILCGILAVVIAIVVMWRFCREHRLHFWKRVKT